MLFRELLSSQIIFGHQLMKNFVEDNVGVRVCPLHVPDHFIHGTTRPLSPLQHHRLESRRPPSTARCNPAGPRLCVFGFPGCLLGSEVELCQQCPVCLPPAFHSVAALPVSGQPGLGLRGRYSFLGTYLSAGWLAAAEAPAQPFHPRRWCRCPVIPDTCSLKTLPFLCPRVLAGRGCLTLPPCPAVPREDGEYS